METMISFVAYFRESFYLLSIIDGQTRSVRYRDTVTTILLEHNRYVMLELWLSVVNKIDTSMRHKILHGMMKHLVRSKLSDTLQYLTRCTAHENKIVSTNRSENPKDIPPSDFLDRHYRYSKRHDSLSKRSKNNLKTSFSYCQCSHLIF